MSDEVLVPFSVAAAALGPSVPREAAPHHQRLIALWRDLGVLVVPEGDVRRSALVQNISALPEAVRKYWQSALAHALTGGSMRVFSQAALEGRLDRCAVELPAGCSELARVVAADRATLSRVQRRATQVEFATVDVVDQTSAFSRARELATSPMPRHGDVAQAWNQRIRPLFRIASRRITLVDRHAASHADYRRRTRKTPAVLGLSRFLTAALSLPDDVEVEVITGANDDKDCALMPSPQVVAHLADFAAVGPRRRVHLRVIEDRAVWGAVHYRGIAVDGSTFLHLDYGIEAFDGANVRKTALVTLQALHAGIRRDLEQLRQACTFYEV